MDTTLNLHTLNDFLLVPKYIIVETHLQLNIYMIYILIEYADFENKLFISIVDF